MIKEPSNSVNQPSDELVKKYRANITLFLGPLLYIMLFNVVYQDGSAGVYTNMEVSAELVSSRVVHPQNKSGY